MHTSFNDDFSQRPIRIFSKFLLAQWSIMICIKAKEHVYKKNEGAITDMNYSNLKAFDHHHI